jgi:hypothetical protein
MTALTCSTNEWGWQVCRSDDGSLLTFTLPNGTQSISFRSFRESSFFGSRWKIGTKIETSNLNFIRAIINSRYYHRVEGEHDTGQTCAVARYDSDQDSTSWSMDEYEEGYGLFADASYIKVESLCRVQWHGRRFSGVVSTGEDCWDVGTVQPWPMGYPADWPPLETA